MKYKIILILVVAFLPSCASRTYNLNFQRVDLEDTVATVRQNHSGFNSLRGMASVSVLTRGEKIKFQQVTVLKKDKLMRLEALAAFGAVIAQIFSDSEKVYLNTRYEQVVFDNTDDFRFAVLYPEIPRDIGVEDLLELLLSSPSQELWANSYRMSLDGNSGKMMLDFDSPRDMKLTINPAKKVIDKLSFRLSNGQEAVVEYSEYKNIGEDTYFPQRIRLTTGDYDLTVTYGSNLEVNPVLEDSIFRPNV